jgi:hexosaminidase
MKKINGIKWYMFFSLLCAGLSPAAAQQTNNSFALIPYPAELTTGSGGFSITEKTLIITEGARFNNEAQSLKELIAAYLPKPFRTFTEAHGANRIVLKHKAGMVSEGYELSITENEIQLRATDPAGMFRAVETIRQMLPVQEQISNARKLFLPSVQIADHPKFAWRGMHLDVARHFFSVEYLKKFIDLLALYKFNKLHLHLTDDQGWRIEIKKYPKLTAEGGWRELNNQDSACISKSHDNPDFILDAKHIIHKDGKTLYGGFYTRQEMKGIVAYATARHIDIIPELDMPGHMMSAINSYPFLTCNGENKWGKTFTTPICPCKESTFEFAQNVFNEIMSIFPGKYIHIGGDEVDRSSWEASDVCKDFMAKNGLKTSAELQSYFINRMEKFFNAKGRKLIGWDEILEDGIRNTAMVMYWRSWVPDAPIKAAKNGNLVVMSPGNPLYFDTPPDKNSLANVYNFNPIPKGLNAKEAKGIVGAQANTWSEMIPSENRADYMIFPRMTALAENLWSINSDYQGYLKRLNRHYPRLEYLGVRYRLPDIPGLVEENVFTSEGLLNPTKPLPGLSIRYTTDGSLPNGNSTLLEAPLLIKQEAFIRLAAFTKQGNHGDVYNLHYKRQKPAEPLSLADAKGGLLCNYFPGAFKSSKMLTGKPEAVYSVNNLTVPSEVKAGSFGLKYQGYIDVPEDGIYSFFLICDDGGILNIAEKEVVNNDGWHAPIERSGQVALKKGLQPLELNFVEGGGGYTLSLKYCLNGSTPTDIPANWLKH